MKPLNEQFAESMHQVAHAWRTELDRRLRPQGFSHSRWLLLLHLSRHDGCPLGELASLMGLEAATLVRQVDHLEKEGLLKRHASSSDRRIKHLHLTAAGKTAVERIRGSAAELRGEIFAGIDAAELTAALRVLEQIRGNLSS